MMEAMEMVEEMVEDHKMIEIYLHLLQEVEPIGTETKDVPKCPEGYNWWPVKKECVPAGQGRGRVQEYEDVYPNLIDHCLSYDCPKKKIICLNILRQLNGGNPQYTNIIDRYIDDITGNYNPSGEIADII